MLSGLVLAGPAVVAQAATSPPATPSVQSTPPPGQDDSTLAWSVRPTPTAEAPDRPNYAVDAAPGVTVDDSIRIRNYDDAPMRLDLYASDAIVTSSGALDLLPAGEQPTDVGVWIELDTNQVVVPADGVVDVPFTLTVPDDAEPGDHTGGIVTSLTQPGTDTTGEPVILDRRLGSRVHVRVTGELRPTLQVTDLTIEYTGTANPAAPGDLRVDYTVTNTGNVRLEATQAVTAAGPFGLVDASATVDPMPELLPGSSLSFSVDVPDVWPAFRTTAQVALTPTPARNGDTFEGATTVAAVAVATIPWPQLVILVLVAATVLGWRWTRHRRRTRESALVEKAVQSALADHDKATVADAATADTTSVNRALNDRTH